MAHVVEILCFGSCPSIAKTIDAVHAAVRASSMIDVEVREVRVETEEEARKLRFLGSPTVRVDGRDVDPSAEGRSEFALQCRLYREGDATSGTPPLAWIRAALERGGDR